MKKKQPYQSSSKKIRFRIIHIFLKENAYANKLVSLGYLFLENHFIGIIGFHIVCSLHS